MTSDDVVWSWWVRVSHWLIAAGIIALWVLVYVYYETDEIHRYLGYTLLGLMLSRVLMGFVTQDISAKHTFPSWQAISAHLMHLKQKQLPDIRGHNPLGQLAVYAIWTLIALLAYTGWLSRTDAYWGEDWPVDLHAYLSCALMAMVVLHLAAVALMSKLQKKNLVKTMIFGKE